MTTKRHHELSADDAATLRAELRGEVILPGDDGYERARAVYNAMIDRRPAAVAYCADAADVAATVSFARERGLKLAVRGGGHNGGGLGVVDHGVVCDLSRMRGVQVHPEAQTAWVQGGATWGDVDHATHAVGLATPSGVISTTGVGGLTLGGGHGYLTRRYGLTIDNLRAADVVLADGRLVRASAERHPELFWALRGGGGNFGVVTALEFRLHPVHTVIGGPMLWELERAEDVLRWYREYLPAAPEEVYGFFAFLTVPGAPFPPELHGRPVCGVIWCYLGPPETADAVFDPIRTALPPLFEHLGPLPYPALQSMHDVFYPAGHQWYWRADFVDRIPDEAIRLHCEFAARMPSPQSTMHLYPVDGAPQRVGRNDTAWSYREARFSQVIVGVDPDPAKAAELRAWTVDYWEALHPHSAGGAYVNFMMDEGQERVRATYRDNYPTLAAIKAKYDPDNLFRSNQNIRPEPGPIDVPSAAEVTLAEMVAEARRAVEGVDAEQAARELERGAVLVDLREPDEQQRDGVIPGAVSAPRGMLEAWADPRGPGHREEFQPDKRLILHSAQGTRSALAAQTLKRMGYRNVVHLEGGIDAWQRAGKPVVRLRA